MNKLLQIPAEFVEKQLAEDDGSITIKGYANTVNKDRVGDVIQRDAWTKGGLADYLKNPIVLAFHDHRQPIGKTIGYTIDELGLQITAKISKSAGPIVNLINEGILKAFSVGVRVKDADYDSDSDTFIIKDVELHEVSVVAVPANQDSLFSVSKCFEAPESYEEFKKEFIKKSEEKPEEGSSEGTTDTSVIPATSMNNSIKTDGQPEEGEAKNKSEELILEIAKELDILKTTVRGKEENSMENNDIQKLIADELAKARAQEAAEKAAKEAEEARKREIIELGMSGAQKLVADLEKKLQEKDSQFADTIAKLQNEIVSKSEEISKIVTSRSDTKMVFGDREGRSAVAAKDADNAILLSKILKRPVEDTFYGKQLLEKAVNDSSSTRVSSADWEQELANRLEEEIQLQLRVASLFREVPLNARQQIVSINPDMGYAGWVTSAETHGPGDGTQPAADHRTDASTDPEVGKTLAEVILTAPKMAAKTYMTDETEEDAIIPLLPLIREGLVRAHARKVENALIFDDGVTAGQTFITGLIKRATTLSTAIQGPIAASDAIDHTHVLAARRAMGKYGIDNSDLIAIVSVDTWYDLLEDPDFANMNEVGAQAQKLTGQVGNMYGVPFIVSPEMAAKANGAVGLILVNSRNFLLPRRRGLTLQSDYDVEKQRRVLVATQRLGFSHIISAAKAVATVRYDDDGA